MWTDDKALLWVGILSIAAPLLRLAYVRFFLKKTPFSWVRDKERRKALVAHTARFQKIFENNTAFSISIEARKRLALGDTYVYGEISFESFVFLLDQVKPKAGEIFYDLGCGAGKALCVAALCYPFHKVIGVEYLDGLHALAVERLQGLKPVEILHADLHIFDFSNADVVFANATCFSGELWERLLEGFERLKAGTRIVLTTSRLESPLFYLLYSNKVEMSWGLSRVNVYVKQK